MEQTFGYPLERTVMHNPISRTLLSSRNLESGFTKPAKFGGPVNSDFNQRNRGIWSNLRDTFRLRKADIAPYDENSSPRTNIGRRKSLKDIFVTVREMVPQNDLFNSASAVMVEQEGTLYPSKSVPRAGERRLPALASATRRRKSLSGIVDTIAKRVSPSRHWRKSFRAQIDKPDLEVFEDPGEYDKDRWQPPERAPAPNLTKLDSIEILLQESNHRSLNSTCKTSTRAYITRSASPEPGPQVPIPSALCEGSVRDSFGAQSSLDRIVAKYEVRGESDHNGAINNVDRNIQLRNPTQEPRASQSSNQSASRPSLADIRTHSLHLSKLQAEDQLKCLAIPTASTPEVVILSVEGRDIDPEFDHRLEVRKNKYRRLNMKYNDLEVAEHEKIATGIRMTLARMAKHYNTALSAEENSSDSIERSCQVQQATFDSDEHQKEFLQTIVLGKKILSETKKSPVARRNYLSQPLYRTPVGNTNPAKIVTPTENNPCHSSRSSLFSLKSNSTMSLPQKKASNTHATTVGSSFSESRTQGVPSAVRHYPLCSADFTGGIKCLDGQRDYSRNELITANLNSSRARIKSASSTRSKLDKKQLVSFDPVHVKYPQTKNCNFRMEVFETKAEAMAVLSEQNLDDFDKFYTYDPKAHIFDLYPQNTVLPSLAKLQEQGLEVFRLPARKQTPLLQGSAPSKLSFKSTHDMRPSVPDTVRPTRSKEHGVTCTAIGKGSVYPTDWPLFSNQPEECQKLSRKYARSGYISSNPQDPDDAARESRSADSDTDQGDSIFDENHLLEIDPYLARSYLGSQYDETGSVMNSESELFRDNEILEIDRPLTQLENTVCVPLKDWTQLGGEYLNPPRSNQSIGDLHTPTDEPSLSDFGGDSQYSALGLDANCLAARIYKYSGPNDLLQRRLKERRRGTAELPVVANALDLEESDSTNESDRDDIDLPQMTWTELGRVYLESRRSIDTEYPTKSIGIIDDMEITPLLRVPSQALLSEQTREIDICNRLRKELTAAVDPFHQREGDDTGNRRDRLLHRGIALRHMMPLAKTEFEEQDTEYYGAEEASNVSISQISDRPSIPLPSGFKFTSYAEQLMETPEEQEEKSAETSRAVNTEAQSAPIAIECCQIISDDDGRLKPVTAHDLNIRFVSKAARRKVSKNEPGRVGALVDIFQSQGLMPQDVRSVLSRPLPPVLLTPYKRNSSRWTRFWLHAKNPADMENCRSNIEDVLDMKF